MISKAYRIFCGIWDGIVTFVDEYSMLPVMVFWLTYLIVHTWPY